MDRRSFLKCTGAAVAALAVCPVLRLAAAAPAPAIVVPPSAAAVGVVADIRAAARSVQEQIGVRPKATVLGRDAYVALRDALARQFDVDPADVTNGFRFEGIKITQLVRESDWLENQGVVSTAAYGVGGLFDA